MIGYFTSLNKPGACLFYHAAFWFIIISIYYLNYYRLIGCNDHIWIFILKDALVAALGFYSLSPKKVVKLLSNTKGLLYALLYLLLLYLFWGLITCYACLIYKNCFSGFPARFGKFLEVATSDSPFAVISNIDIFGLDFIYLVSIPMGPGIILKEIIFFFYREYHKISSLNRLVTMSLIKMDGVSLEMVCEDDCTCIKLQQKTKYI